MASRQDRWTWMALAFAVGLVAGAALLWPDAWTPTGPERTGVPSSPVPLAASIRNGGTEDLRVDLVVQNREGRVVHRYDFIVEAGARQDVPMTDLTEGTFLFVGTFRLDDRDSGAAKGDLYVTVGRCGPDRTSGVVFRVAGTRAGPRLDGMDEACL